MTSSNSSRKQITDLSQPMQIRELNRQLDWICQQLLGGLTEKAFSKSGINQITERITDVTGEIYDPQITSLTERIEDLEDSLVYPKSVP